MTKPEAITTRRNGGEYSTIAMPNGVIETMFFPDDRTKPARLVCRTRSLEAAHRQAIEGDDK